jgi:hypothetical protein
MYMPPNSLERQRIFDLGHQGDLDYTQIAKMLAMTPTERLRRHERWRYFVKEVASRAKLLRRVGRVFPQPNYALNKLMDTFGKLAV